MTSPPHGESSPDPWDPSYPPPTAAEFPTRVAPTVGQGPFVDHAPSGDRSSSEGRRVRRGPGWGGVAALVLSGMLLSSGATLVGVVAYDQLIAPTTATEQESEQSPSADPDGAQTEPVAHTGPASDWSEVVEKVAPSAVAIQVRTSEGASQGTGVVLDTAGSVLTNNHVVADAQDVQVTLTDGLSYAATVVGTDPSTDIAVIRLDSPPEGLQPATFGDSEEVAVGDPVMAVGTPLGLENTVTTGIVSAVDRPVTTAGDEEDGSDATYTSALQTDAAINPGNSGGPLVDARGQVVGINTAIAAIPGTDRSTGNIGLGFAIPSNTALLIAEQLSEGGSARHAFVGVTTTDGTAAVGEVTYRGAEVVGVEPDSPASRAGVREDDLVTAFDDVTIGGAAALTGVVRGQAVGSEHTLTVVRAGQELKITLTLGERP